MAEAATIIVNVAERNPEIGQTQNGKPKLGVKTSAGKWVQITGQGVEKIQVGSELVISEPRQFGKAWFADLKEIKALAQAALSTNGNGAKPHYEAVPKKLTWDEFERTFRAAHAMVMECEPDEYASSQSQVEGLEKQDPPTFITIDRSAARATMINTIVMALTKDGGRVEPAPSIPF